ncbi:MAG: hypothetical protein H7Y30_02350 [Pyrinomonadaceae bacterium]|nr:hypothetical protein [Pyrinomonadaceae bacterium]
MRINLIRYAVGLFLLASLMSSAQSMSLPSGNGIWQATAAQNKSLVGDWEVSDNKGGEKTSIKFYLENKQLKGYYMAKDGSKKELLDIQFKTGGKLYFRVSSPHMEFDLKLVSKGKYEGQTLNEEKAQAFVRMQRKK